ncbi:ATP-binding protein [Nonomuraea sp. NPDC050328]|uniref:ATP-binding protein n=1 Tax=Nonomuraea sp. NPDC050328 TaxID=3364361 RepID=UPI0037BE130B
MDTHTPRHPASPDPSRSFFPPAGLPPAEQFPDLAPGLVMSTFRTRRVWEGMAWRRAFPGRGDQSALARRMVGQLLADTERADDARWVTAELVSNALRHTRSGQGRGFFVVEVLLGIETARIVVYDLGGGPVPDFSRSPDGVPETAEDGRGLAGVAALAVRVGAAGDAVTGHAVWADLALTVNPVGASVRPQEVRPCTAAADAGAAGARELVVTGPVAVVDLAGRSAVRSDHGRKTDRVSAFGQEPWAQQALAELRRNWPDWAFLVVRYRWLAIRGKQVIVSATDPQELRYALPPIHAQANPAGPVAIEHRVPDPALALPTLDELLRGEPGVSWIRTSSPPPIPASTRAAGGLRVDGGPGAGLSGPLTGAGPSLGMMVAECSVTGTWAVADSGGARSGWWPSGWWRLGRRRGRSRSGSRTGQGADAAGGTGRVGEGGPRHRRARTRLSAPDSPVAA